MKHDIESRGVVTIDGETTLIENATVDVAYPEEGTVVISLSDGTDRYTAAFDKAELETE